MSISDRITVALNRTTEAADVDFKSSFDVDSNGDWLEIIKDVVAMANTGGGVILVGLADNGSPSKADTTAIQSVDPADFTNRIYKYTGHHFCGFEFVECQKGDHELCAICVAGVHIPIVFTRVGTYEVAAAKQKTAFSVGTVYFRHGAKSEPGSSDDLRIFLERELELTRKSWLDGIAKVVESPTGSRFAVLPPESAPSGPSGALAMRLTDDPDAPAYYAVPIDNTHPFRQKEVLRELNTRLAGRKTINTHDILCIRRVYSIQKDIAFCYTQNFASPRYSQQFVDWIISQFDADAAFFDKAKMKFDVLKAEEVKQSRQRQVLQSTRP
jgi:hypothetical protein